MSDSGPDAVRSKEQRNLLPELDDNARTLAKMLRLVADQLESGEVSGRHDREPRVMPSMPFDGSGPVPKRFLGALARSMLREFDMRERFVCEGILSDPAWQIVLDLYVHELKGRRVSVSSACAAARVPQTTALRWLRSMEERGIVQRLDDPDDGRRMYVTLTQASREGLEAYLTMVLQGRSVIEQIRDILPSSSRKPY